MAEFYILFQSIKVWLAKNIYALAVGTFAALAPIHPVLATTTCLVVADFFLGSWASKKRGEVFASARSRDSASKLIIYLAGLTLSFFSELYMLDGLIPVVRILSSIIAVSELRSLYENSGEILGEPLFKVLVRKLGSKNRD